jgi:hypothetical protein
MESKPIKPKSVSPERELPPELPLTGGGFEARGVFLYWENKVVCVCLSVDNIPAEHVAMMLSQTCNDEYAISVALENLRPVIEDEECMSRYGDELNALFDAGGIE